MKRNFKRVLAISDLHCGHRVGLTPPKYQNAIPGDKYYRIQIELWEKFAEMVDAIQPIDILFGLGDLIDGKGSRSGSTELITADVNKQCEIAIECINYIQAPVIKLVYGTPYHTGVANDDEKQIADALGATIESHSWYDVNGTVFDLKHFVGNSTVPYGKTTQLAKDQLQNALWAEHEEQPHASALLRGHVHFHADCGYGGEWRAMSLPALQGQGSKFGARKCSGVVHFGIVYFDCYDGGEFSWTSKIVRAESQKRRAVKL